MIPRSTTAARAGLAGVALALAAGACSPYGEVLVIGHRGSPLEALENSMASFQRAYEQGADGVELDVQVTADGVNVVMHDDTVDRTTDCEGLVSDTTLDALRGCSLNNGEPIQTLAEMLAATADLFDIWFLEIKVPEDQSAARTHAQTDEAIDTVLASGLRARVVIISYDDVCLKRVAARSDEGVIGGWDDTSGESIADAERYHLPWVAMPVDELEPWRGDIAHGLHKQVAVYGVNTPTDYARALDGRADALMSRAVSALVAMAGNEPR